MGWGGERRGVANDVRMKDVKDVKRREHVVKRILRSVGEVITTGSVFCLFSKGRSGANGTPAQSMSSSARLDTSERSKNVNVNVTT